MANRFIRTQINAQPIMGALTRLERLADDMQPAMEGIGRALLTRVQFGFRRSQDPWGAPWRPLVLRRGQPLVDTGILRRSMGYRAERHSVSLGTNIIYAPTHQFGGRGFWGSTIPARPFLPIQNGQVDLPPAWSEDTLNVINRMIRQALRGGQ